MPARLRCFDPADWGARPDASQDELRKARDRQSTALLAWCREHDVSPLAALLQRRNDSRRAEGIPPIDDGA